MQILFRKDGLQQGVIPPKTTDDAMKKAVEERQVLPLPYRELGYPEQDP